MEFNGDDYISLAPMDCLVEHSFTIQAWIKSQKQDWNVALAQGDATSTNRYLHWGVTDGGQGTLRFYGDDLSAGNVSLNKWYHLVGVYDKAKMTARVYLNGEEVGTKAGCAGLKSDVNLSDLEIGACYGRLGRGAYFDGIIDEVGIYDRALSYDEIEKNYRGASTQRQSCWENYSHLGKNKDFKIASSSPRRIIPLKFPHTYQVKHK